MKKLLLLFAAILMASTGMWAETVDYLYPVYNTDGVPTSGIKEWKTASVDATVVEDAATPVTWGTAGETTWYVVTGTDVTLSQGAICSGNVNLILADGAKLTATGYRYDEYMGYAGIQVSGDGNSLTIYGQTAQTGQLEANGGDYAAGIGGKTGDAGSNITINGGIVTAHAPYDAGIGGGEGGAGFNITINRGIVTANGNEGAGIGGGYRGNGYNITINGGTVTANGNDGAGIGGGDFGNGSNITINGGTVTANGNHGAGIGGGASSENGSNITINGGTVTATSDHGACIGNGYRASTPASNIKVATKCIVKSVWEISGEIFTEEIATDRSDETDIADDLAGMKYVTIESISSTISTTYIDENGEVQEVVATEARSSATPVTWGVANTTTWYIANDVNVLLKGAICQGDVRLILADGAKLTATGWVGEKEDPEESYNPCYPGIQVSGNGNSITIYGQANQSGQIIANGGEWAAGIGGGYVPITGDRNGEEGSDITINGGIVTATGGLYGAGIGGGNWANGSNITINGGMVTANGGGSAAGIGGGDRASGSNITINGGTVTATGGNAASGIGGDGGGGGSSNNIRVATTLLVKADGNNPPTEEIEHDGGGDIAGKLHRKQYATIVSILPFRDAAIAGIDAAFKGITNENMKAIATTAKKNIEAATTTMAIGSIKEKALADLQYVLSIYNAGKTDAFGTLGEKQNGPAVILTDKDGKEFIFYSPKSVEYIKVNE